MKSALWICFCVVLAGVVRCHDLPEVFVAGQIYFTDADCYSRMTRARLISEQPGLVLHHHLFENYPAGASVHTTAPLDYLIVGLRTPVQWLLHWGDRSGRSVLRTQALDLAGALISPLLGMAAVLFLGCWASGLGGQLARYGGLVPLTFAISPILVHGTVLGRPDHQSLLIALLAVALGAEARLAAGSHRNWAIVSGIAWASALWVSFYEPAILLLALLSLWLAFAPRGLFVAERRCWLASFVFVLSIAFLIEGWPVHLPDRSQLGFLKNWSRSIGELAQPNLSILLGWLGLGLLAAPVSLALARRLDRRAWPLLALLLILVALTCWQVRWGYFLGLVFAMSLPWQLAILNRRWLAWSLFLLALWPMAAAWETQLYPPMELEKQRLEHRREMQLLREVAQKMQSAQTEPFLAPWWLSPAVAYWSRQPGVAGSSHESIAGTVDSARVYLAANAEAAVPLLRARRVHWLIADEPARLLDTSRLILNEPVPERPLGILLTEQPHSIAPFLVPVFANDYFKLFAVDATRFPL